MTVPTPPSPDDGQPQHYDPWAQHPPPGPEGAGAPDGGEGLPLGREAREAAAVAAAVTLLGVALGLLWWWLAPRVPLVSDGQAVFLKHPEGEEAVGADGTFVLLALGIGALAGTVVFWCRRQGGAGLTVGLLVGGVLASLLAWRLGVRIDGPGDVAALASEAGRGNTFQAPLELQAKAALLALPFAALLVHLLWTALFGKRDPEPPVLGSW